MMVGPTSSDEEMRNFEKTVLESEHTCVQYLRQYRIFAESPRCPEHKSMGCGKTMNERAKNKALV